LAEEGSWVHGRGKEKLKLALLKQNHGIFTGIKTTYLPIPWSMLPVLVSDQPVSISVSVEVLIVSVSALVPHKKKV
jgi:hypothetical protein